MLHEISARIERWPLKAPFRISRAVRTEATVVVAELGDGRTVGRGECVPYARYGESPEGVVAAIESLRPLAPILTRATLDEVLPAGAARNAVDCALWDLEARRTGTSVAQLLGRPEPPALVTAVTVSLDAVEAMAAAAARLADAPLVKIKVGAEGAAERIEAVARAAPRARFIVDPNESWSRELLIELQPLLARSRVALVEQPLPSAADAALAGAPLRVPVCADESIHVSADLQRVARHFQAVNVKLDKTGGLTEALRVVAGARARGLGVMVGCMVCTGLGIAPALHVAASADFVDLDGPWWLAQDREGGPRIAAGMLSPPAPQLWGGGNGPAAA